MKNTILIPFLILASLLTQTTQAAELVFEKDRSLPLLYVTVAFRAGSTQDPDGKNGLTDIMAKLMLRGTKSKTKQQIDLVLDQLGASLGVETRAEFVAIRGSVLSENVPAFLDLLNEIITTPSFRAQELEKLKKEGVSQLLEDLSTDRSLARLRFDQVFFKGHPYSKSNQGRIKDIQGLTVTDLQKQYQRLINQNEMIVLAAGDAEQSELTPFMNAVQKARNGKSALNPIPEFTSEPAKLRVMIFDKPDRTQTQVLIGQKGVPYNSPMLDALQVANYAFGGGGFQSRLMIELRVKRGWTYGAGSGFKLGNRSNIWRTSFFPKNGDTPAAIKEALSLIRELKAKGLTQKEFDFAKQSMINGSGFSYNTPAKRMDNRMTEILFGLPQGYMKDTANRLEKLTLADVNQAIKSFLNPDHMMIGLVGTASVSRTDIAKALEIPENQIEVQDYMKE